MHFISFRCLVVSLERLILHNFSRIILYFIVNASFNFFQDLSTSKHQSRLKFCIPVKFMCEKRLEIIKNYYRNSEWVVTTLRALTPIFGRNNCHNRLWSAILDTFCVNIFTIGCPCASENIAGSRSSV